MKTTNVLLFLLIIAVLFHNSDSLGNRVFDSVLTYLERAEDDRKFKQGMAKAAECDRRFPRPAEGVEKLELIRRELDWRLCVDEK